MEESGVCIEVRIRDVNSHVKMDFHWLGCTFCNILSPLVSLGFSMKRLVQFLFIE